jgi:hypothetical protein
MGSKQNAAKRRPISQCATGQRKSARKLASQAEQDPDPAFDVPPRRNPRPRKKANLEVDLEPVIEEEDPGDVSIHDIISGQEVFELDSGFRGEESEGDDQEDDENGEYYSSMGLNVCLFLLKRNAKNLGSPSAFHTKMPRVILWSNRMFPSLHFSLILPRRWVPALHICLRLATYSHGWFLGLASLYRSFWRMKMAFKHLYPMSRSTLMNRSPRIEVKEK